MMLTASFCFDAQHRFSSFYLFPVPRRNRRTGPFGYDESFTAQDYTPPPRGDKGLGLLAEEHWEQGVCSFHVISGTLPVMATPNAGLCSFTGQRIHKCFISCCKGTFVRRGSSDIPAKQFGFFFLLLFNNTRPGEDAPLLDTAHREPTTNILQ